LESETIIEENMFKNAMFWIFALIITLASAVYQEKTGPTYPLDATARLGDLSISCTFQRTHAGAGDQVVVLEAPDAEVTAQLAWRRFKSNGDWLRLPMIRQDSLLTAPLPHQPPAGKLEYHLEVFRGEQHTLLPTTENVVIRFRGDVPAWVLVPHILFMFAAMLVSTLTGLQACRKAMPLMGKIRMIIALLFAGGFVFGPIVQKFAFGELWTGFPFGTDLTDNKTLIALVAWIIALLILQKRPNARWTAVLAALVTLSAFMIPHSLHGSELDYAKIETVRQTAPLIE
jgi:hypothetical protein